MTWVKETPRFVAAAASRHPVWFTLASIVFWTLLSPLALVWLALWSADRYRALDKSPGARRERRVARLLRWYPAPWRERYGEDMAATLHDTIANGRGGVRMSLNVAREGVAARFAPPARRHALMGYCLWLCWIPLFPQGIAPAIMKLTDTSTRSWFVALYLPEPLQWPFIVAMLALGAVMLRAGLRLAGVRLSRA